MNKRERTVLIATAYIRALARKLAKTPAPPQTRRRLRGMLEKAERLTLAGKPNAAARDVEEVRVWLFKGIDQLEWDEQTGDFRIPVRGLMFKGQDEQRPPLWGCE